MNEKIRKNLIKHNKATGFGTNDDDLIETLEEAKLLWEGDEDEHRWWTCFTRVVEVDGMYIAYGWAKTTGDMSAKERGWEFDPSFIHEVKPVEETVTIITYKPITEV